MMCVGAAGFVYPRYFELLCVSSVPLQVRGLSLCINLMDLVCSFPGMLSCAICPDPFAPGLWVSLRLCWSDVLVLDSRDIILRVWAIQMGGASRAGGPQLPNSWKHRLEFVSSLLPVNL